MLGRYPALAECFASARPLRPLARRPSISYWRHAAARDRLLLLPHAYAFFDPLFSTGMAWSLLAVERVASMFEAGKVAAVPPPGALHRYEALLTSEAHQIHDLVEAAYLARGDFRRFAAVSGLYFAAASFQELSQRLLDPPAEGWALQGFLGATDPVSRGFVREGRRRLAASEDSPAAFETWAREAITPRNAIGLMDPRRRNLYPVDLDVLRDRSSLLGLEKRELDKRLPRLRG